MRESGSNHAKSSIVQKEKQPIGKLRKQSNVRLFIEQEIKKRAIESKRPSKHSKKRGGYQNWYPSHLWPPILVWK
jgi:hypothetical protein